MHTLRSELIRIWRPAFHAGIGVMALFAALVSVFIFTSAEDPTAAAPTSGEGPPSFTIAEIASPGGFLTALSTVSTLAGVILLVLWAIAAATDYGTGLIRILVQAHPNILESPQTPGFHRRRALPPTAQGNELNNAVQGPGCLFARARARPGACGSRLPVVRPGSVGGHRSVSPSGRAPGIRGRTHRESSTLADDRSPGRHGGSFPYPT